jgi:molybdenum cofactor cytidylyltransferase
MKEKDFKVAAIVLAAGKSRRMGESKMTMPFGESTMVGSVVQAISNSRVSTVTVVLGYYGVAVRDALTDFSVDFAINRKPDMGMLSSVQAGMKAVGEADAYLICLGDQPHIKSSVIDELVSAASRGRSGIFVPAYDGKRGHPLLFTAEYRAKVMSLPLSGGLNALLDSHKEEVTEVPVDEAGVTEDIDTPEDYTLLSGQT